MQYRSNRRDFLKRTAATGAGLWLAGRSARAHGGSPNEKLNIGVIGVGGRGEANLKSVAVENIVALCDVDEAILAKAAAAFPRAEKYSDVRRLIEAKGLDAVVISTPDHCHASAASMALRAGLHVYCEKPLTRTIDEARVLARLSARQPRLATQMGTQGHSMDGTRRFVELVRSGAIGPIREVHAWTDRPIWPQGLERPAETPAIPAGLHWDLWLGPAPDRPYHPAYLPFKWRGWWGFGTGALGDMACHLLDAGYWALGLEHPVSIEAEGPPVSTESAPVWSVIRWAFPARGALPPVRLTWYDGGRRPPAELFEAEPIAANGTLFVGDRGKIYSRDPYSASFVLLPKARFAAFEPPAPSIPNAPEHHEEWIRACKTGSPTGSHFRYAASLTETVLLGNLAYRAGRKLEWDAQAMRVTNVPDANALLWPEYRKGWNY